MRRRVSLIVIAVMALAGSQAIAAPVFAANYTSSASAGTNLRNGDTIFASDGRSKFVMQADGNAVIYRNYTNQVLWASGTSSNGARFVPQSDGNNVIYSTSNAVLWQSATSGAATRIAMQDDGNLVTYGNSGAIWSTGTSISNPSSGSVRPELRMDSPVFATRNGTNFTPELVVVSNDARKQWNDTVSPASISFSNSSTNQLYAASYSGVNWLGLYTVLEPGSRFKIQLNTSLLSQLASQNNFDLAFVTTNTLVHEYGHALGLKDDPPVGPVSSIMRNDRPRNEWKSPRVYDVENVNANY